jgi:hypothetical protein
LWIKFSAKRGKANGITGSTAERGKAGGVAGGKFHGIFMNRFLLEEVMKRQPPPPQKP